MQRCQMSELSYLFVFRKYVGIQSQWLFTVSSIFAQMKLDIYIYIFSDVPNLTKTARNCLVNAGAGRAARYM